MMKNRTEEIIAFAVALILLVLIACAVSSIFIEDEETLPELIGQPIPAREQTVPTQEYTEPVADASESDVEELIVVIEENPQGLDDETILYIAMCVKAEAGNQSELGQRLVCDVIINRYREWGYSSYSAVINAKNQFECVSNGSIYAQEVSQELLSMVKEELANQTNTEVLYFRTEHYHTYGTPLFVEGAHYFNGK